MTLRPCKRPGSQPAIASENTFYWQGKEPEEPRIHGVGLALKNSLLSAVESPSQGTPRILSLRLPSSSGPVNILSIYAPPLSFCLEVRDEFYEELEQSMRQSACTYLLTLTPGSEPRYISHYGVCKMKENGQSLLELFSFHDLYITNTFFHSKPQHRLLAPPQIPPLAPAGSRHYKERLTELRLQHPQLPQR